MKNEEKKIIKIELSKGADNLKTKEQAAIDRSKGFIAPKDKNNNDSFVKKNDDRTIHPKK